MSDIASDPGSVKTWIMWWTSLRTLLDVRIDSSLLGIMSSLSESMESRSVAEDRRNLLLGLDKRWIPSAVYIPPLCGSLPVSRISHRHRNASFDAKKWVRAFYNNKTEALGGRPPNSAGLAFKDLNVFGQMAVAEHQRTVEDFIYGIFDLTRSFFRSAKKQRVDVLQDLEGVMESGEMLCVLGPPGSGCSILLKTIAGNTYGFQVADGREAIYTAEVDYHFLKLTVGETLYFAARARCPQRLASHKHEYAEHLRDVVMAMLGISITKNTVVGDDFIRGVSGGERKRRELSSLAGKASRLLAAQTNLHRHGAKARTASSLSPNEDFETRFPIGGSQSEKFRVARTEQKSNLLRAASPFALSLAGQFVLNFWRSYRLLIADPWFWITLLFANFFESLVVSSIFYNMQEDSSSIFRRNLFISYVLMISIWTTTLEVLTLYSKRKIVEKHVRYALYHPSMEALASIAMDILFKLVNVTAYFTGNLRRELDFIPSGPGYTVDLLQAGGQDCSVEGSEAGQAFVDGAFHLRVMYNFVDMHRWRNFGIFIGITAFFLVIHLIAVEVISSERSKGEILIFPRQALKRQSKGGSGDDEKSRIKEDTSQRRDTQKIEVQGIEKQTSTFHWQYVCYTVKIKDETGTILDHVDGWVKPGTLTALMGVSGAEKTTPLDVLASRVTMVVISGRMLVNAQLRDSSFQRKTGYVTQQDLDLHTSTVREALQFSALLRQPARYSRQEKLDYMNDVIILVDLDDCADAIVGHTGEGLNAEQRKRLTIGVELAARPELLLFLDEPTSGLDSQISPPVFRSSAEAVKREVTMTKWNTYSAPFLVDNVDAGDSSDALQRHS
ncbi:CDR ABC transporter-domain-containing protein [Aspergillus aurantiobrunneus]